MLEPTKEDYESLAEFRSALRRFLRFTEASAREAGITPQQYQTLLAVMGQRERDWASVGEIRDALQLAHHATVGLVDRCQTAGLVVRTPHDADRRVVRVSLTEAGRRVLAAIATRNLAELRDLDTLIESLKGLRREV